MSKGGGGGPDSVTQNTSTLPEYAEPYYKDMLARTGYESAVPYTPYGGPRLEYFNQSEQEAMARMRELGTSGTPDELETAGIGAALVGAGNPYAESMMQSTENAQQALTGSPYHSGYYGGQYSADYKGDNTFDPGTLENNNLQGYMNPFQQQVIDVEKREAGRQSDIRGRDLSLDAAGQGSLGGYREAIMQAERERNLSQEMGDIQARGSRDAFANAQSGFEADRAAGFGAYQAGESARQEASRQGLNADEITQAGQQAEEQFRMSAAGMGYEAASQAAQLGQTTYQNLLAGGDQQLAAYGMVGDFTAQRQAMEYERIRNMQASGEIQRSLDQQGLDVGYQDFLRQQAYPKENLAYYSSILHGLPIQPGSVQTAYGVGPSTTQQLLGTGIAGVGLYNAFS